MLGKDDAFTTIDIRKCDIENTCHRLAPKKKKKNIPHSGVTEAISGAIHHFFPNESCDFQPLPFLELMISVDFQPPQKKTKFVPPQNTTYLNTFEPCLSPRYRKPAASSPKPIPSRPAVCGSRNRNAAAQGHAHAILQEFLRSPKELAGKLRDFRCRKFGPFIAGICL